MTTRFASDAAAGGDGSADAPYRDPGDLPTPWLLTPGEEYLFHTDTPFNFESAFANTTYTTSPIVLGTWGGNGRATISKYRMLDRSECVEVTFSSGDVTALQSGTNLWRMPRQFFGLLAGRVWGARCDVTGATNSTPHTPDALGEWTYADSDTSTVIYSPGNPVDVFGGVFVNTVSDADYATAYKRYAIYGNQPGGGLVLSGIDFTSAYGGLRVYPGTAQGRILPGLDIELSDYRDLLLGLVLVGDGSVTSQFDPGSGNGFTGAHLRNLYGENLGGSLISTPSSGLCLNRLRLHDFVVNGCGKAQSSGAIYLDHAYTNDGERGIVELGTVTGQEAFHFWPTDGYAFYSENSTRGFEWRRLFGWGNSMNFHFNFPGQNNVMRQCVAIANPDTPASYDDMISMQGPDTGTELTVIGCVAVGFRRLLKANSVSGSYIVRVRENVSRSVGDTGGGSNANAIRVSGGYSSACWAVDGNSFYGHDYKIYDVTGAADKSSEATNGIASDPQGQITPNIPTPTNPKTNYAMFISPNYWSGTVDLQRGMGMLAAPG